MISLLIVSILALDLSDLQNYQPFNKSLMFKSEIQIEQSQAKVTVNSQNEKSSETRLKQILYEQEEQFKPREAHALPVKIKTLTDDSDDDKISTKKKSVFETSNKLAKKALQRELIPGKNLDNLNLAGTISQEHKIIIVFFIIIFFAILVLMRESYGNDLNKHLKQALWQINLRSFNLTFVIVVFIELYYNNYFDRWLLEAQILREYLRGSLLLIDIKDYEEVYRINLYAYLLVLGIFNIIQLIVNLIYLHYQDVQLQDLKLIELNYINRSELAKLYHQEQQELQELQDKFNYTQQLGGGEQPELLAKIKYAQEVMQKTEPTLMYCVAKQQFIRNYTPYLGPTYLDDTFPYCYYIAGKAAQIQVQIADWNYKVIILIMITLVFTSLLLQLMNIYFVAFILIVALFCLIVQLYYQITQVATMTNLDSIEYLFNQELEIIPKYLEPVLNSQILERDPLTNILPFKSYDKLIIYISFLSKFNTIQLILLYVYFMYWQHHKIHLTIVTMLFSITLWYLIHNLIFKIINTLAKSISMDQRDPDLVYEICKTQKFELIKSCQQFYEFAKYLRRSHINTTMSQEKLIIYNQQILEIVEICKRYQHSYFKQQAYDDNEQILIDLGLETLKPIQFTYLTKILSLLDINFDQYQRAYCEEFIRIDNQYFSALKFIVFLQHLNDEIIISPKNVIIEILQDIIPNSYDKVTQFEGPNEHFTEQDFIQINEQGHISMQSIEEFLMESVAQNKLEKSAAQCLIGNLYQLDELNIPRIASFIENQISQTIR